MKILGIDGGIASIGWGFLDLDADAGALTVIAAGVLYRLTHPETAKERTPSNAVRRLHRGQRRVIRRRRQRMNEIRRPCSSACGLLPSAQRDAFSIKRACSPGSYAPTHSNVQLTNHGTRRCPRPHRSASWLQSNAKRDTAANAADETSKMKKAIARPQERLQGRYRTVGANVRQRSGFPQAQAQPRRFHPLGPACGPSNSEVGVSSLSNAGVELSSHPQALEAEFSRIAFFQRPLQDSEHHGPDFVRSSPKRSAPHAVPTLSRCSVCSSRLADRSHSPLAERIAASTLAQIGLVAEDFGKTKGITYKSMRKLSNWINRTLFVGVSEKERRTTSSPVTERRGRTCDLARHRLHRLVAVADAQSQPCVTASPKSCPSAKTLPPY